MKIFSFLFAAVFANPMNLLIMNEVLNDDDNSDSNDMLMLMLMSPGLLGGNPMQAEQMNPLLPLILLDDKDNKDSGKFIIYFFFQAFLDLTYGYFNFRQHFDAYDVNDAKSKCRFKYNVAIFGFGRWKT